MTSSTSWVTVTRHGRDGPVAEVALNRPEAMNAISTAFARQLEAALREVAAEPTVRAVVLSSTTARAFCVGADLKERRSMDAKDLLGTRETNRSAYAAVLDLPVPAVAAVAGYALGGGFELALSCDLIVAAEGAVFALPEVGVGLMPGGGGTQLLTRRVGWSRAAGMVFTARRVGVEEAARLGVVDEVAAPGTVRQRALELAWTISQNSPTGVRNAKAAMRAGAHLGLEGALDCEDDYWRRTVLGPERAEGIAAFNEKRPPSWHPGHLGSV
ncbi:MAG: enoyl-CoA hydratase-related protein [Ornithinimicrobium sp.]